MKVLLCSGWDSIPTQFVFGELVKLASPIVKHYHSDLYHDAEWLRNNLQLNKPFYYGIRDSGTDIGERKHTANGRNTLYKCELTLNEIGSHYLTITEEAN